MKSYVSLALAIYGSILDDATTRWPNLQSSFERDISCLVRAVKARGLPFLTITLPDAGKALFQRLDRGDESSDPSCEYPKGYPMGNRRHRPKLFGDLYDLIFDDVGLLRSDADVEAVKFLVQLMFAAKNMRLECHPSKTRKTLDEFFAIEEHLPTSYDNTWDFDTPKWSERQGHPIWGELGSGNRAGRDQYALHLDDAGSHPDSYDLPWSTLLAHARQIVRGWIGNYPEWDVEPKHGPGAVSEAGTGVKYDFPNWPRKLEGVFPYDWYGSGSLSGSYHPDDGESPSRLIAVPKSQKGPRLICAEPVAHQWIQQGIWRWLEQRILATPLGESIKFRDQSLQQQRALSSSHDGSLCTIDLSAASDRISTRLVEYLFQGSNFLDALHASRTRYMVQSISPDHPRMVKLKKFSTMGSAVTFPVQSLVFFILTTWAVKLHHAWCEIIGEGEVPSMENIPKNWGEFYSGSPLNKWRDPSEVSVFGDDIIAPNDAYCAINLVLTQCGLKVNQAKTFTGSNFRESCGMYAFRGVDISPAYILETYDGSPESLTATIEASNNFHVRGMWYTANTVVSQIPEKERKNLLVTGLDRRGGLGLVSFCGSDAHLRKKRWDKDLHRHYVKVLTVRSNQRWIQGSGQASLSQYFFESPDPDDYYRWKSGRGGRAKLRKCFAQVLIEGGAE